MLTVRKAADRGHANHGWLESHHTFSFADYHDPKHMAFSALRVINDDRVAGGSGFPPHGHRDMEIITYVVEGALAHKDSMGNGATMRPGDVQRMSAGTGVTHSEFNASQTERAHFYQIWILPEKSGLPSGYEQKMFSDEEKRGKLRLVASRDGQEGSVKMQQDARLYATILEGGEQVTHAFASGRKGWLQVVKGAVEVGGKTLEAGDGVAIEGEAQLTIGAKDRGEALLFDLP